MKSFLLKMKPLIEKGRRLVKGRWVIPVVALALVVTLIAGTTLAYIVEQSSTLTNTFKSGAEPKGSLAIQKIVRVPDSFGPDYELPSGLSYTFEVDLGADSADKTFKVGGDEYTADSDGKLTLTLGPGEIKTVEKIPEGTSVTVTEKNFPAYYSVAPSHEQTATIVKNDTVELEFTNNYNPSPVPESEKDDLSVTGTSVFRDRPWNSGEQITYDLAMLVNGTWTTIASETVTAAFSGGTLDQGSVTFDFTDEVLARIGDEVGTFSFRITQRPGNDPDFSYDQSEKTFSITVSDNDMDGNLEMAVDPNPTGMTVTSSEGKTALYGTFENRDQSLKTTDVIIRPDAELYDYSTNTNLPPSGFVFRLYRVNGENRTLVKTTEATNDAGRVEDIVLTFDETQTGAYYYALVEEHGGQVINGLHYDGKQYNIKVEIEMNGEGALAGYVSDYDPAAENPSNNGAENPAPEQSDEPDSPDAPEYAGQPDDQPTADDPADNNTADDNPADVPADDPADTPADVPADAPADDPADDSPSDSLPQDDAPQDDTPEDGGTPSTDGGQGEGEGETPPSGADMRPSGTDEAPVRADPPAQRTNIFKAHFFNYYLPEKTDVVIEGTKTLEGRTLRENEFEFALWNTQASFSTSGLNPVETVSNAADGTFAFRKIEFDKVGTCYYVVSEKIGSATGIKYDTNCFYVTVRVTDNSGKLRAQVAVTDKNGSESPISFVNTYVPPVTDASFEVVVNKVVRNTGVDTLGAENFEFVLLNLDTNENKTARSGSDGVASFNIAYSKDDIGKTYHYKLTEAPGSIEGMKYSDAVFTFEVRVETDSSGNIRLVALYNGAEVDKVTAEFVNVYEGRAAGTETEPTEPEPTSTKPSSKPTGQGGGGKQGTKDNLPTGDGGMGIWLNIALMIAALASAVLIKLLPSLKKREQERSE